MSRVYSEPFTALFRVDGVVQCAILFFALNYIFTIFLGHICVAVFEKA